MLSPDPSRRGRSPPPPRCWSLGPPPAPPGQGPPAGPALPQVNCNLSTDSTRVHLPPWGFQLRVAGLDPAPLPSRFNWGAATRQVAAPSTGARPSLLPSGCGHWRYASCTTGMRFHNGKLVRPLSSSMHCQRCEHSHVHIAFWRSAGLPGIDSLESSPRDAASSASRCATAEAIKLKCLNI